MRLISGKSKVFQNKEVLDLDYIPQDELLLYREEEKSALKLIYDNFGNSASSIICYGFSGTGKTCTAKFLAREQQLNPNERIIYVNLAKHPTELQAISEILYQLNVTVRGHFLNIYYRAFEDTMNGYNLKVLIILDEFDKLLGRSGDNLLYNLLDNSRVSLIMITNNVTCFDRMEDRVKSRLGSRKILFEPYNANMIRDILLKRAEVAFRKDVLEPTVIPKIAALSAQYHGDIRKAIGLLKHCGEIAEERNTTVKESYIDIADEMTEENLLRGTIKSFPLQVKVLLEALVLALEQKGTPDVSMSELYEKYAEVASSVGMGLKVVSDKRVADYIWELDNTGITYSKITSKRYGKERLVKLGVPMKILKKIIQSDDFLLGNR